jgi:hypothetical protein
LILQGRLSRTGPQQQMLLLLLLLVLLAAVAGLLKPLRAY